MTVNINKIITAFSIVVLAAGLSGAAAAAQEKFWEAINTEEQYLNALTEADPVTFEHMFETPFLLLLHDNQKRFYGELVSLEKKKEYIEAYWKLENPNPILDENEWLHDFIVRRKRVENDFSLPEPPYYDDRGRYYLKYGKPRMRHVDGGGLKYSRDLAQGSSITRGLSGIGSSSPNYSVYPNETWSYEHVVEDLVVHFVKEGSRFEEVKSLANALKGNFRIGARTIYWWELIKTRAIKSPLLNDMYSEVILDPGSNVLAVVTPSFGQRISNLLQNREKFGKLNAPPAIRDPEDKSARLTFTHDISQFRGPNGITRLEITFLTPIKENLIEKDDVREMFTANSDDSLAVEYRGLMRDLKFDSLSQSSNIGGFPVRSAVREDLLNAVGTLTMLSLPRMVELTLQVKDIMNWKRRYGYSKQDLKVRNFSGRNLMISDLQFFTEIQTQEQRQALPGFVKVGNEIAPYPYPKIRKSEPLLVYYEIYNLISGGISGQFAIEIKVTWDENRESVRERIRGVLSQRPDYSLTTTQTRTVTVNSSRELLSLDLGQLNDGPYIMQITIVDPANERISASVQKEIKVVK